MEHNQSNLGLDQCHDCGVRRKQVANPTTNYGFVLPTPTDLVTDLPADFDVALQGVDTQLKALQPGTTLGDLAYSSATANTNTRLPIGTTGQVLAVVGGVPAWATTADQTPLTTKGDLFTFDTADARIGVGANGTVLTADSAEATGLKWATPGAASYTWTSYTPTVTSQGGSITTYTASGKYLKIDKGLFFIFTVILTNVGTATGNMIITLPFTAVGSSAGSVYEYNTTGQSGSVSIAVDASTAITRNYTNSTWFSNGFNLFGSIFYEVA
jgi:hypothetical protein